MKRSYLSIFIASTLILLPYSYLRAQTTDLDLDSPYAILDDKVLLEGYTQKYSKESKNILLAIIQDDTLSDMKIAAAVRVFRDNFSQEVFSKEKKIIQKILLRRLNRTDSPFVQVEILHTICRMDRYKYFKAMVPALIQKLDHYNLTVNETAYNAINDILQTGSKKPREANIVFNTLRKNLFLSRRHLKNIKEPDARLTQKLQLVRWAIKILGTQELRRLPKEVINLL